MRTVEEKVKIAGLSGILAGVIAISPLQGFIGQYVPSGTPMGVAFMTFLATGGSLVVLDFMNM